MISVGAVTCEFDRVVSQDNGMRAEIYFKCFLGERYFFEVSAVMDLDPDDKPEMSYCGAMNDGY